MRSQKLGAAQALVPRHTLDAFAYLVEHGNLQRPRHAKLLLVATPVEDEPRRRQERFQVMPVRDGKITNVQGCRSLCAAEPFRAPPLAIAGIQRRFAETFGEQRASWVSRIPPGGAVARDQ